MKVIFEVDVPFLGTEVPVLGPIRLAKDAVEMAASKLYLGLDTEAKVIFNDLPKPYSEGMSFDKEGVKSIINKEHR